MGRGSVETIHVNYGQDGEVLVDLPPNAAALMMDSVSYGLALKRTTQVLGIEQRNSIYNRIILNGDASQIGERVLDLAAHAEEIARTSSYEQINYEHFEAQKSRVAIQTALVGLVDVLPAVTESGELIDVCEQIIGRFSSTVERENNLLVVKHQQAPWRLTPEERAATA